MKEREGHLTWRERRETREEGGRGWKGEGERRRKREERKMHVARCVYTEHAYETWHT